MIFWIVLCCGFVLDLIKMELKKECSFFNLAKIKDNAFQLLYQIDTRRNI
jgi:hypothetical protein